MQNLVSIYELNASLIQRFIISSIRKVGLNTLNETTNERLFNVFPNLELLYECDEGFVQISPNYRPDGAESSVIGADRSYLVNESAMGEGVYFHDPYISTATGQMCVTVVYATKRGYIFLDFKLRGLLERFNLIEERSGFRMLSRYSYALIGGGLLFFGIFVVLYGMYSFGTYFFGSAELSLDIVFKPVIALTLGLAVFDLGKTIYEQEVLPKTQHVQESFNAKTLLNFSVSIIIALLIEALLVVFKISISDYRDLPYAATLIGALAALLLVFSLFIYLVKKSALMEKKCLEKV
ncbi:MAG: hypothetical protein R3302_00465 [Sulfurimonadaceae bacterium]|nr:hypothetical protein [Sulfurimonadaceae bacterium]